MTEARENHPGTDIFIFVYDILIDIVVMCSVRLLRAFNCRHNLGTAKQIKASLPLRFSKHYHKTSHTVHH